MEAFVEVMFVVAVACWFMALAGFLALAAEPLGRRAVSGTRAWLARRAERREAALLERQARFLRSAAQDALQHNQLKLYVAYRAAGQSCERRAAALGARS
jgi:hypothetical protein